MEQSKFLNEVERDKKLGDTEAAASGAKVLRYYLEFSRDAKKNQKVNKSYISGKHCNISHLQRDIEGLGPGLG